MGVIFVMVCCGGLSGLFVLWLLVLGCWFLPSSDECVLFLVGKNLNIRVIIRISEILPTKIDRPGLN